MKTAVNPVSKSFTDSIDILLMSSIISCYMKNQWDFDFGG